MRDPVAPCTGCWNIGNHAPTLGRGPTNSQIAIFANGDRVRNWPPPGYDQVITDLARSIARRIARQQLEAVQARTKTARDRARSPGGAGGN